MKKVIGAVFGLAAFGLVSSAALADTSKMVGKWTWEGFTVEVTEGGEFGLSAKVIDGPKNVGMEMIKSKLEPKDGGMVGKIAHPMTGDTYNAQMTNPDADTWHMDGCTDANVCASGDFKRVK